MGEKEQIKCDKEDEDRRQGTEDERQGTEDAR
jgi:hypothetical protein